MNKQQLIEAILEHVKSWRKAGAPEMYFHSLATDDGETTFGDLVDALIVRSRE